MILSPTSYLKVITKTLAKRDDEDDPQVLRKRGHVYVYVSKKPLKTV